MKKPRNAHLERLVDYMGGICNLANVLEMKPNRVGNFVVQGGLSPKCASEIESLTGGKFKRKDLVVISSRKGKAWQQQSKTS